MFAWLKKNTLPAYFVLAYAISWAVWIPIALTAQGWVNWHALYALYYVGSLGPMASALIVTAVTEGLHGLSALLGKLLKWRVGLGYYAFAVLVPIGLFAVTVLANRVVMGAWSDLCLLGEADYLPYVCSDGFHVAV